jgi:hypothetical protein
VLRRRQQTRNAPRNTNTRGGGLLRLHTRPVVVDELQGLLVAQALDGRSQLLLLTAKTVRPASLIAAMLPM